MNLPLNYFLLLFFLLWFYSCSISIYVLSLLFVSIVSSSTSLCSTSSSKTVYEISDPWILFPLLKLIVMYCLVFFWVSLRKELKGSPFIAYAIYDTWLSRFFRVTLVFVNITEFITNAWEFSFIDLHLFLISIEQWYLFLLEWVQIQLPLIIWDHSSLSLKNWWCILICISLLMNSLPCWPQ